jgi:site-specific DNA recombinase
VSTVCAIYVRKSDDAKNGIDVQIAGAKRFIASKKWSEGPTFVDNDIRGKVNNRPGFDALLAAVEQKHPPFGAVVAMNVERVSRGDIWDSLKFQHRITERVELWFYETPDAPVSLKTAKEQKAAAEDAAGAKAYSEKITKGVTNHLLTKHLEGKVIGAVPYGYRRVSVGVGQGEHGKDDHVAVAREIDPAQAAIIRQIFRWSAEGLGDRRIAAKLNAEKVDPPRKGEKKPLKKLTDAQGNPIPRPANFEYYITRWTVDAVGAVLANRLYVGESVATFRGEEHVVAVPDCRIVEQGLWDAVQTRKAKTRAAYLRDPENGQLLSKPEAGLGSRWLQNGIARCGKCGGPMVYAGNKKKAQKAEHLRRYYCARRLDDKEACEGMSVPMLRLDKAVIHNLLTDLMSDKERLWKLIHENDERLQREQAEQEVARPDPAAEIAKLEQEINHLIGIAASGKGGADLGDAIDARRAKITLLKEAAVEPPTPITRKSFLSSWEKFRLMIRQDNPDASGRCSASSESVGSWSQRPKMAGFTRGTWTLRPLFETGRRRRAALPRPRPRRSRARGDPRRHSGRAARWRCTG